MKKTKFTLLTVLLMGTIGFRVNTVFAADYDGATNVNTEGSVTILENITTDPVIPDPDNPGEEIEPEVPTNPHEGQLRINYISNFDFGKIKNVSSEIVQQAQLDRLWSGESEVGRVPFVATEDRRGSERLGWELQVSQPNQLIDASGHELQGATISLSGLRYSSSSASAPIANQNTITLSSAAQTVATADSTQGSGAWSMAMGTEDQGNTNGVVLRIPANTTKNDTMYSTSIVWELVADPTNG